MTREGFWAVRSRGPAGEGVGMIVLDTNMIVGADASGIVYDGTYSKNDDGSLDCKAMARTTEQGIWLVNSGQTLPKGIEFPIEVTLPRDPLAQAQTIAKTPYGNFTVTFHKIRDFPPGS